MAFYIAKGLQVSGLAGVAFALYVGMTQSLLKEIALATISVAVFYAGRRIER